MEQAVMETENEIACIESLIHECAFYEQEYTRVQAVLDQLDSARKRLDALYERWQYLESRKNEK